jgi:hypothetical protein
LHKAAKEIWAHLPYLRRLFEKFFVVDMFGVQILHRHFTIPDGSHLVGRTTINDEDLYLTELTDDKLNPNDVCGRKFMFDAEYGTLYPSELHYGPMPDTSKVDPAFFGQFSEYIIKHELTLTLGLIYIPQELLKQDMYEYVSRKNTNLALRLVRAASPGLDNDKVSTTFDFSDPRCTRKTDCIPDRNNRHPANNDSLP